MVFQFDCTNTLNDQLLQKVPAVALYYFQVFVDLPAAVKRYNYVSLGQVVVQMEPSESYEVVHYIPAASLPYSQPGSCYTLVRLPDDDPTAGRNTETNTTTINNIGAKHINRRSVKMVFLCSVTVSCTFSCTMKYLVRDCDPNTGEPDDDGYDDEYVVRFTHIHIQAQRIRSELVLCKTNFLLIFLVLLSWRIWR